MKDSLDKPLFDEEELAGTTPDDDDFSSDETTLSDGSIKKPVVDGTSSTTTQTNDDEPGNQTPGESSELDEGKLQAIADQLSSLDDEAMAAAVRGMPVEAKLQGQKCMSLLEPDHGDLQPITVLVSMGERMVKGDSDSDLLEVKTLNMSLTGVADGGQPRPVKVPAAPSNGFDEAEASKAAEERWKSVDKTTPAMWLCHRSRSRGWCFNRLWFFYLRHLDSFFTVFAFSYLPSILVPDAEGIAAHRAFDFNHRELFHM